MHVLIEISWLWVPRSVSKIMFLYLHIFGNTKISCIITAPLQHYYFLGQSLTKKKSKIDARKNSKKTSKACLEHRFWHPCWGAKTSEITPKSDVEQSLFRDAMDTAPKSSETNGPHYFVSPEWLIIW